MAETANVPFPHTGRELSLRSLTSDVHYEAVLTAHITTSPIPAVKRFARCAACVLAVAWCAGAIMSCGGGGKSGDGTSPTPTGPSPPPMIPAGNIELDEPPPPACVRDNQTTRCDVSGSGKNAGPGCVGMVRVTLRVLSGETEVAVDRWTGGSRVFMPDEQFTFQFRVAVPNATFAGITSYTRQSEWVNVRC